MDRSAESDIANLGIHYADRQSIRASAVHSGHRCRLIFCLIAILIRPVRVMLWAAALTRVLPRGYLFFSLRAATIRDTRRGVLRPVVQRNVFSPRDGEIKILLLTRVHSWKRINNWRSSSRNLCWNN